MYKLIRLIKESKSIRLWLVSILVLWIIILAINIGQIVQDNLKENVSVSLSIVVAINILVIIIFNKIQDSKIITSKKEMYHSIFLVSSFFTFVSILINLPLLVDLGMENINMLFNLFLTYIVVYMLSISSLVTTLWSKKTTLNIIYYSLAHALLTQFNSLSIKVDILDDLSIFGVKESINNWWMYISLIALLVSIPVMINGLNIESWNMTKVTEGR